MNISGILNKLASEHNDPINYFLRLDEHRISLNTYIGTKITLKYLQEIYCIQCQRKTKKSFQQGHCYVCYQKLLECNLCVIHPERCKHPHETCPDNWQHAHCKQDHIIYIANSSGLKVGITRDTQTPTRWIDQGAIQALPLFKVKNRYQSGIIEVALKKYLADKTNWRKMLTGNLETLDMINIKHDLLIQAKNDLEELGQEMELLGNNVFSFTYPVQSYPTKLNTFTFDKADEITATLLGIKGQYLIFDNAVLNIRKHSGYKIMFCPA